MNDQKYKMVLGETYPIKDFIKKHGGKWNGVHWSVPEDKYNLIVEKMKSTPQKKEGRGPYIKVNGYCNLCETYCYGDCTE